MEDVAAAEAEESALVAAARLGSVPREDDGSPTRVLDDEAALLRSAREDGESPLTAEVVELDVAAERGHVEQVRDALIRSLGRAEGRAELSGLLALSSTQLAAGELDDAAQTLQRANAVAPGHPLATRPLARLAAASEPAMAGGLLLSEVEELGPDASPQRREAAAAAARFAADWFGGEGERAARAIVEGLDAGGDDPASAFRLSWFTRNGTGDAPWAEWRARADEALGRLFEEKRTSAEQALRVARAVTSSGAEESATTREEAVLDAAAAWPHDLTLLELAGTARASDSLRARVVSVARAVEAAARATESDVGQVLLLRRAASLAESAGDPALAATWLRELMDRAATSGVDRARERNELDAGEHARVADRKLAALRDLESVANQVANAAKEGGDEIAGDDRKDREPGETEPGDGASSQETAPEHGDLSTARRDLLFELAELDLRIRGDVASAALTLRSILELTPDDVPALRALERLDMDAGRRSDLAGVSVALLEALPDPSDRAAYLRFAAHLFNDESAKVDDLYLRYAGEVEPSETVARRWLRAAELAGGPGREASLRQLADLDDDPLAKVTHALRAAEVRVKESGSQGGAAELGRLDSLADHPVALALLGVWRARAGYVLPAAEALAAAAKGTKAPPQSAALWYETGCLFQDEHEDDRALAAFEEVARFDLTHADLFDRMRRLLTARRDHARLAELISARLERGADTETMASLHEARAELCLELGQRQRARDSLSAALGLVPDSRDTLERLAKLSLEDDEWELAEGALIRWARLEREPSEQRFIFFSLGEIYREHRPDPQRAEASYARVLKIAPYDLAALDRIVDIFAATDRADEAVRALERMVEAEPNVLEKRTHRLRIGATLEQMGRTRDAEAAFEATRRQAPTDIVAIEALADFFERQRATPAREMHLARAKEDFRRSIVTDPGNPALWTGFIRTLMLAQRRDPARCVASAGAALQIAEAQIGQPLLPGGTVPGAGHAAGLEEVIDKVRPESLDRATLALFARADAAFEKAVPFDVRSLKLDRALAKDHPLRQEAVTAAANFGLPEPQVRLTAVAERACVPLSLSPPTLVVSTKLAEESNPRIRAFLFARAFAIASSHLSVALKTAAEDLGAAIAGLAHVQDADYAPEEMDLATLRALGQKVYKAVPRRDRADVSALALESCGRPGFNPSRIALDAASLGNRAALVATGDLAGAVDALMLLHGRRLAGTTIERVTMLTSFPEASELFHFALSEDYFEARAKTGAEKL